MNVSIYTNVRIDKQYKALTGLSIAQFDSLFERFNKLYIPKTGNRFVRQELQSVLTDAREALFFILFYYKSYPTLVNLGTCFGFSESVASRYLEFIKPVLKACLQENIPLQTHIFPDQHAFGEALGGVDEIYIDVTEIQTQRPVNDEVQKDFYSGKKSTHLKILGNLR